MNEEVPRGQKQDTKEIFEQQKTETPKKQKKKIEGIKVTPEMEKAVDARVNEMLGIQPSEEKKETKENGNQNQ